MMCVSWCIRLCFVMNPNVCRDVSICVCAMTHLHVWNDVLIYLSWRIHIVTWHTSESHGTHVNASRQIMCFVMYPYVCRNISTCVCAMTHLHVWNDVLICVSWCIHIVLWHTCESHGTHVNVSRQIMYPYVCRDVSICVPCLTCMCAVKYPYVCRNAFT